MKNITKISLAWVIIPLIYGGCAQDNISKLTPSKHSNKDINKTDKNTTTAKLLNKKIPVTIVKESDPLVQDEVAENLIDVPKVITLEEGDEENTLTSSNEEIIDNDITTITAPTVEDIEENWIELSKEDEVIDTAKSFLGTKYVWAANGPNAFDCSGFTKYVFREVGINLPRYSGHQAKVGIPVTYDELQKGDLVFFDTEHKFRGKVNHVGIYIGDGKFIHASSAGKRVMITSFREKPFYKKRFLRGERVINVVDSDNSTYASL